MALDLFTPVVERERQHPVFRQLCGPEYTAEREVVSEWGRGFVDRDGKLVKEFQTTFESSLWELYVFASLKELGASVDFRHSRPDFVTTMRPTGVCIEATVAQPPDGGSPAFGSGPPDLPDDLNEFNRDATVRFCNRFTTKADDYKQNYASLEHVGNKPFVIAFAPFDRPASQLAHNRPIIAALYGVYFDEEQTIACRSPEIVRYPVTAVSKSASTDLSIGYFTDAQYAHVSAVLYSPLAGMGKLRALADNPNLPAIFVTMHPNPDAIEPHVRQTKKADYSEHLLDGLYVIHNPHATNPLDTSAFNHHRVAQLAFNDDGEPVTLAPDDFLQFRAVWSLRTTPT